MIRQVKDYLREYLPGEVGRIIICISAFLGMGYIVNWGTRPVQEMYMFLIIIFLSGLLMRNVWVTLFIWWTVFLFFMYRFTVGQIYVHNVFYGALLYYMVKRYFKREHIKYYFDAVLWFIVVNLAYIILQLLDFDAIYQTVEWKQGVSYAVWNYKAYGFMHFEAAMGMLMVIGLPLMLIRKGWLAKCAGLMLFVPIWLSKSSLNVVAGVVVAMFVLFYQMPKKYWVMCCAGLIALGTYYTLAVDRPNAERMPMWKYSLREAAIHPVLGWGLDSFRNNTPEKPYTYVKKGFEGKGDDGKERLVLMMWDNPHNLYISLIYEWGIFGVIILIGYWRQMAVWFKEAVKSQRLIGLAGVLIGAFFLSIGHFPFFLSRLVVIILVIAALFEVEARQDTI